MKRWAALLLSAGCAPAPPPAETASRPSPTGPAPAASAPTASAPAAPTAPPPTAPPAAIDPCPAAPPPEAKPPEAKTAQPGDGAWTPFGEATALYKTVLHPHPQSRFVSVTLAALDLCRLRLGYMPGKDDVPKVAFPLERGLVPAADRASLVAVFNGGYKPEHGRFGMYAAGVSLVPPKEGACTVGITKTGGAAISSQSPSAELVAYRQTPPCLVEASELHPRLVTGDEKPWGGRAKDVVTRRRSAVGIDPSGRYLFYAVGEEASPRYLGRALLAAGASAGAQLDINWYWTRLLLFGQREGRLAVTATLIDGMEFQSTGYVERPSDRDFFYVLARTPPAPP